MDANAKHDRTIRLLEARLEVLASVSERSPRNERQLDREIIAAAAATRHAVALQLISPEEADSIWGTVAQRHPLAGWCRGGFELAA